VLEPFFFVLGIMNSALLIFIFLIRRNRLSLLKRVGWVYFLLAIPACYGFFLVAQEQKTAKYTIFLAIFLAFLAVEWLFDYVLKVNFRENRRRNWRWVLPYLSLYYAMNYGFVVMPWKASLPWGVAMLCLFVVQIITNLTSHPKTSGQRVSSSGT
jgi:peptidoglycan/LPS O-acetylase OafA/YrhL